MQDTKKFRQTYVQAGNVRPLHRFDPTQHVSKTHTVIERDEELSGLSILMRKCNNLGVYAISVTPTVQQKRKKIMLTTSIGAVV